jgi:hypothetical protein
VGARPWREGDEQNSTVVSGYRGPLGGHCRAATGPLRPTSTVECTIASWRVESSRSRPSSFLRAHSTWATTQASRRTPAHRVELSAFRMAVLPVTNEGTRTSSPPRVMSAPLLARPAFNHPHQPVVGVSWYDAVAFCDWLGSRQGTSFDCRPRRSGRRQRWRCRRAKYPGATSRSTATAGASGRTRRGRSARRRPTATVSSTSASTSTNGARLVLPRLLRRLAEHDPQGPPSGDLTGRRLPHVAPRAAAPGTRRQSQPLRRRSSIPPDYRYNDYGFRVVLTVEPNWATRATVRCDMLRAQISGGQHAIITPRPAAQ